MNSYSTPGPRLFTKVVVAWDEFRRRRRTRFVTSSQLFSKAHPLHVRARFYLVLLEVALRALKSAIRPRSGYRNNGENQFRQEAFDQNWRVTKRGWPDFVGLDQCGQPVAVEVKPRGRLSFSQAFVMALLQERGITCFVWTDIGGLTPFDLGTHGELNGLPAEVVRRLAAGKFQGRTARQILALALKRSYALAPDVVDVESQSVPIRALRDLRNLSEAADLAYGGAP